jgi:Zn-dependent peptidase ImmA (M78 family)
LKFVNLPKLAAMKPHWRVSMNALLYRAAEIGAIDSRRKSYLWMLMGQSGYRKSEPVVIPREEPTSLSQLLNVHQTTLGYRASEIDEILFEPGVFSDLRRSLTGGGLRLVK